MNTQCSSASQNARESRLSDFAIVCGLVFLCAVVFAQTVNFDFVNYDDGAYVYNNAIVLAGITPAGVRWAFTRFHEANWHPLTWISLMMDANAARVFDSLGIEIDSTSAGIYHLTNVILHTANTLLLFAVLSLLTGTRWRSAFVAALFAVHPLHVESVAWVTERKDVLSTLFWLLTTLAYVRWVRQPSRMRYQWVFVLLALGLMAKPMLVTLPIVLILLDFWPLNRLKHSADGGGLSLRALVTEKMPLFALVLCSCVITVLAQRSGGAVVKHEWFPLVPRIFNAIMSYEAYVLKMVWPVRLGVFYPMRLDISMTELARASIFLLAGTLLALLSARRRNFGWFALGWFWYVITLLPVIGFVQVGMQAMADRYTYVPLIGLLIIAGWGGAMLAERLLRHPAVRSSVLVTCSAAAIAVLTTLGYAQAGYWRSSTALFKHTTSVIRNNYSAEIFYGAALEFDNNLAEALVHYKAAERMRPAGFEAPNGIGTVLTKMGAFAEAEASLRRAVKLAPDNPKVRNNLGGLLLAQGRVPEAIEQFERALKIDPEYQGAIRNLDLARSMDY